MKFALGDYMKAAIYEEDFFGSGNEQLFSCWAGFFPSSEFPTKVWGKGLGSLHPIF